MSTLPIVVIGGGLSGLATAVLLAQRGQRVVVLERSSALGGRARSPAVGPLPMNLGAHALYRRGVAEKTLRACGVVPRGFTPPVDGLVFTRGRALLPAPSSPAGMLWSPRLSLAARAALVRALFRLGRAAREAPPTQTWAGWLAAERSTDAAAVLGLLARLSTYADAPDQLSAAAVLRQVDRALGQGVLYLDGGWQTLVDALADRARSLGVELRLASPVARVAEDGRSVALEGGAELDARAAVLAVPLRVAAALTTVPALHALAASALPGRVATWDAVVSALPNAALRIAQGLDTPTYFSVHSRPDERPTRVHAHWVLRAGEKGADALVALRAWVEQVQPGLGGHVVAERALPELQVADALPIAGEPERPPVSLGEALYAAAEYAQPGAFLLDAALGAAQSAAAQLLSTPELRATA